jgi:hypothetical protein
MAAPIPMLTARTLVLAKPEVTYNVDSVPTAAADAFLVSEADVSIETNVLERNNYRPHLSPTGVVVGRKLVTVTMTHELKGSGTAATKPKLGTLLRGCGFSETQVTAGAASQMGTAAALTTPAGPVVTWAKTAAPTAFYGSYRATITTGGVQASAKVRVTHYNGYDPDPNVLRTEEIDVFASPGAGVTITKGGTPAAPTVTVGGTPAQNEVVTVNFMGVAATVTIGAAPTAITVATALVTALNAAEVAQRAGTGQNTARFTMANAAGASATITPTFSATAGELAMSAAVALGGSGATSTPSFTGTAIVGDSYVIDLYQVGWIYRPVSENFESLTMYVYFDGALHKVTGCQGTFTISGEAGAYANAAFTFTGQYIAPVDAPLPTNTIYEASKPTQVELAQMALDGSPDFCAQSFSVDMAVTIVPRDCINGSDGFDGVRVTGRAPTGTINPEAQLRKSHPFWQVMASGRALAWHVRVGTVAGNIVHLLSNSVQYGQLSYGDRNGIRTIEANLRFSALSGSGNDELAILFQ